MGMPAAGKAALAIAGAGVLLGIVLGSAIDPEMKRAPEAPWRDAGQSHYDPEAHLAVETALEPIPFGGFAPEPDAAAAAGWSAPDDALALEPGEDDGSEGGAFAGYEPFPADFEAERAGREAARAAADAAQAAADAVAPATSPTS